MEKKWIKRIETVLYCPLCCEKLLLLFFIEGEMVLPNACPNCGARLDGVEDEK